MNIKSEETGRYEASSESSHGDKVIAEALEILRSRLRKPGVTLSSPDATKTFLRLCLAEEEREVFCALFLDNKHRVIKFSKLSFGTINGASVHPREVVKAALKFNAAAVIFAHNHPSGEAEPSKADKLITAKLSEALRLIDIRVLDHIIIGGLSEDGEFNTFSFAEGGLL